MTRNKYRSFNESRRWALDKGVRSLSEWRELSKRGMIPEDIPATPNIVYKKKWKSWIHFFGREWKSFEEVKAWVQSQEMGCSTDWYRRIKEGLPNGIPSKPWKVYAKEWKGWEDFFGEKNVANVIEERKKRKMAKWRNFQEVKAWAMQQGIKSQKEWQNKCKIGLPSGIPTNPSDVYKDEWRGWRDFFSLPKERWVTFIEAKKLVSNLGLRSSTDWRNLDKILLPEGVPKSPDYAYKDDWKGWKDFLGVDVATIEEAKKWAKNNGIKTSSQWIESHEKGTIPLRFPKHPNTAYKDEGGWKGWPNFLGTEDKWKSFNEVRSWAISEGIYSSYDWVERCKKGLPEGIPTNPDKHYPEEWRGFRHFIGEELYDKKLEERKACQKKTRWASFEECRKFARSLSLKNVREWESFITNAPNVSVPKNIPKSPSTVYTSEWTNWGDFLGTGNIHSNNMEFRSYEDAKKWAKENNVQTVTQWQQLSRSGKLPDDIPSTPESTYREKWISYPEFLEGGPRKSRNWRSFNDARSWVIDEGLSSYMEFKKRSQDEDFPVDIPKTPENTYSDEWQGWPHFFDRKPRGGSSLVERLINNELENIFEFKTTSRGMRFGEGVLRYPDIIIEEYGIIIQYDGAHYHQDILEKDQLDNILFGNDGWKTFRIREFPLAKISDNDIVVKPMDPVYDKTSRILRKIIKKIKFSDDAKSRIDDYLSRGEIFDRDPEDIDFLGWRGFEEARAWARSLQLQGKKQWDQYIKNVGLPNDIPTSPDSTLAYSSLWISWSDWLGYSGRRPNKKRSFLSYEDCQKWAQSSRARTLKDWHAMSRNNELPENIPSDPASIYRDVWVDWDTFMGGDERFLEFFEARRFARSLNIKKRKEWIDLDKDGIIPSNIPLNPCHTKQYKKFWISWDDWFGIK